MRKVSTSRSNKISEDELSIKERMEQRKQEKSRIHQQSREENRQISTIKKGNNTTYNLNKNIKNQEENTESQEGKTENQEDNKKEYKEKLNYHKENKENSKEENIEFRNKNAAHYNENIENHKENKEKPKENTKDHKEIKESDKQNSEKSKKFIDNSKENTEQNRTDKNIETKTEENKAIVETEYALSDNPLYPDKLLSLSQDNKAIYNLIKSFIVQFKDTEYLYFKECEIVLNGNNAIFMVDIYEDSLRLFSKFNKKYFLNQSEILAVKNNELPYKTCVIMKNSDNLNTALKFISYCMKISKIPMQNKYNAYSYTEEIRTKGVEGHLSH